MVFGAVIPNLHPVSGGRRRPIVVNLCKEYWYFVIPIPAFAEPATANAGG